ncbi:zinc finger MYM-type protein 1-like [Aphis craccivora]|uniref:Zinc finger MYM-type protein 1-like n=1 Tax=Aphis craccivora TaxID=307492 RepID=A0A6G0ZJK0_APHCR|nr:zinc finger MYM-type protein 1-like [Aphis craccivora]
MSNPKTFSLIDELEQFPKDSLHTICNLANLNQEIIAIELKQFMLANFDEDEDIEVKPTEKIKCNKCICLYCAFILLQELSYQSNLFCNLFILHKFVLLLLSTQTTSERIFSKLKIIETKLRSSLHQKHLNPLMLMSIEKDIFIDSDKLIDTIVNSSNQLKKLLI